MITAANGRLAATAGLLGALAAVASLACSGGGPGAESLSPLPADRREYEAFRAAHPGLPEPNTLPFLVHRLRIDGSDEDLLVTCRWSDDRFPLAVAIDPPDLASADDDAGRPTPPAVYVEAAEKALSRWEREAGAPVRFRRAGEADAPDVRIRLLGERAPTAGDDKQVLGMTPLAGACRLRGGDLASGQVDVEFGPVEVTVHVADEVGLLTPEQVETVVAHEIGHALGARSHSPLPADLMHEIARDRLGARRLSEQDARSFAAIYALPNGTVYARRRRGEDAPRVAPAPAPGAVRLAAAAWTSPDLGVSLRLPEGWSVVPIDRGVAAVDGFAWDYDASLQVVSVPVAGIDAYLDRYGQAHLAKGPLLGRREIEIAGRRALRFAVDVEEVGTVEEVTLVDAGDGAVVVAIAEAPSAAYDAYRPWLAAAIESLVLQPPAPAAKRAP